MFKIGQEIVCVDDSNQTNITVQVHGDSVKKWAKYIVERFSSAGGLILIGVKPGFHYSGNETGFEPSRFRPLSDVLAEISLTELMEEPVEC